ncbi:hypothetical protein Tco_0751079 [Tanacetum coccineum]|uniref:Uncharacterized protein n=1 Tax=Tanacetum coccineum TaxID=301880 RepID=A0ABQ4Z313_9ASTR
MTGELKSFEKAKKFMNDMYPVDTHRLLLFLLVGLECSKQDYGLFIFRLQLDHSLAKCSLEGKQNKTGRNDLNLLLFAGNVDGRNKHPYGLLGMLPSVVEDEEFIEETQPGRLSLEESSINLGHL